MKKLLILFAIFITGCVGPANQSDDPVIAKVYDDYMRLSELSEVVPPGLNLEDSLQIVQDHIDKWIRNRLLLHQAQQNLTPEEQNVDRQIDDYRTSLLIFKYEQNFIMQKLDTLITDQEIEAYYQEYSSNFILGNHLLKGIFVKVPRSAPQTWKIRNYYRSDTPEDLKLLEEYCYSYAEVFEYFDEEWKYLSEIIPQLPRIYTSHESLLKNWQIYEVRDSTYRYFLKISDYRLEGAVTPLNLVKDDIRSILLNKRKIQLIQELESNIYNDALNRSNFVVYE